MARTSRWASVGSGTRKARAISGVVEPAERPQRQRDLGVERQGRVAAREDQPQPVVGDRAHVARRWPASAPRAPPVSQLLARAAAPSRRAGGARRSRSIARFRAVVVIQAPGLSGTPRDGPALEGDDERLLDRLLGEVEVAEDADQRCDRPALLLAEDAVDDGVRVAGGIRPERR